VAPSVDQRRVVRGSGSLAQRGGTALVLRPALVRPQRRDAGPAVEAAPDVALHFTKLSDSEHAVCRLGKQRREARAFFTRLDPGCFLTERPPALGQAAVDLGQTSQSAQPSLCHLCGSP
jgi:hypothetical protein